MEKYQINKKICSCDALRINYQIRKFRQTYLLLSIWSQTKRKLPRDGGEWEGGEIPANYQKKGEEENILLDSFKQLTVIGRKHSKGNGENKIKNCLRDETT